jgi:hypothetical protein
MQMRFRVVLAAGVLALLAANFWLTKAALSQGDEKKAAKQDDPMALLARFVGEWNVDAKWSTGESLKARGVYQWGLDKKLLIAKTFVTDMDKEYQRYESIFTWHPGRKSLYEITFSFDGSISEVLIETKEKDTLHIGYTPFHADKAQPIRQTIRFTDNDHFVWVVQMQKGTEWMQLIEATWVRKK